jgi:UDP-3-O-[3-hydroxymyristoyl] N-acetylglucosamine deacetylase
MSMSGQYYQHTLMGPIDFVGPGLHSGEMIRMTVQPAPVNTGYVFVRQDMPAGRAEVPARWNSVTDTRLSTTVANVFGAKVATVEHLMAALRASGIDNARILLSGAEVPIMDGSAEPFMRQIRRVGLCRQHEERRVIVVRKPVRVEESGKSAALLPDPDPSMDMTIDFDSGAIGRQQLSVVLDRESFERDLAAARTFGFREQVETLRKLGLVRGGSLQNAVVLDEDGVLNPEGLRHPDEFVRHKILDAIGDLALAGAPIMGRFVGHCSGHALNNVLLRELLHNENNWFLTTVRGAQSYFGWSGAIGTQAGG